MISLRHKHARVAFGLLLLVLAGLGWVVWPFMASPGQMQGFCGSLAVGASVAQVQAQAAQQGYRVSALVEGRAFVHEPRSFGRFTCDVQFGPNGLVSSDYSFHD